MQQVSGGREDLPEGSQPCGSHLSHTFNKLYKLYPVYRLIAEIYIVANGRNKYRI